MKYLVLLVTEVVFSKYLNVGFPFTLLHFSTCLSMIRRENVGESYNLRCDPCLKCSKSEKCLKGRIDV